MAAPGSSVRARKQKRTRKKSAGSPFGSFDFEGHTLRYEVFGEGERLLVYIHGLMLDAELNRGIATALAEQGNRVVLLDLLGHGKSDKPEQTSLYRMDVYGRQVLALLDHLGVEDAVVGGISLGANVSLEAAAQAPERVRGMVVEMPVLETAVPAAALTFVPLVLVARYARWLIGAVSWAFQRLPRTPIAPLNSVMNSLSTRPEVLEAVLHGILVGPVAPSQDRRGALEIPTLVLAHTNDMIHPFSDAQNLVEQLPDARLVRAHSFLELRLWPERLTREISEFLDEVWSAAAAGA